MLTYYLLKASGQGRKFPVQCYKCHFIELFPMAKEGVTFPVKFLRHPCSECGPEKEWVSTYHFWDFFLWSQTTKIRQDCEDFYLTSEVLNKESLY